MFEVFFWFTCLVLTDACCSLVPGLITVPIFVALTTLTLRLDNTGSCLLLSFVALMFFIGESLKSFPDNVGEEHL